MIRRLMASSDGLAGFPSAACASAIFSHFLQVALIFFGNVGSFSLSSHDSSH